MRNKVWDEITYPFPNFNGVTTSTLCAYFLGCIVLLQCQILGENYRSDIQVTFEHYNHLRFFFLILIAINYSLLMKALTFHGKTK